MTKARIYLAGPEVFLPNAIEIGERKKTLCKAYGFEGLFPLDNELNPENRNLREIGLIISDANERLIRSADFLVANITPFRGVSADVGTVYEMGYARGLGLPVCAYTHTSLNYTERNLAHFTETIRRDEKGVLRDINNMSIEEFGLTDNLMIDGGVLSSSGILVTQSVYPLDKFTSLKGFEECLIQIKNNLKENI